MPLPDQDLEQQFDRKMLSVIETTILPEIGDLRVGDSVIVSLCSLSHALVANVYSHQVTLCRSLEAASKLHEIDDSFPQPAATVPEDLGSKKPSYRRKEVSVSTIEGTTAPVRALPREQFSYWCFDLLFSICAASGAEGETCSCTHMPEINKWALLFRRSCVEAKNRFIRAPCLIEPMSGCLHHVHR
jgi:hypothetical protein